MNNQTHKSYSWCDSVSGIELIFIYCWSLDGAHSIIDLNYLSLILSSCSPNWSPLFFLFEPDLSFASETNCTFMKSSINHYNFFPIWMLMLCALMRQIVLWLVANLYRTVKICCQFHQSFAAAHIVWQKRFYLASPTKMCSTLLVHTTISYAVCAQERWE